MAAEGGIQGKPMPKSEEHDRVQIDKTILRFFSIWLTLDIILAFIVGIVLGLGELDVVVTVFIVSVVGSFFVTGIPALRYHGGRGLIPTKKVMKWFLKISAATAPIFTVVLIWSVLENPDTPEIALGSVEFIAMTIGMFIGMVFAVYCSLLTFLLIGFGMIAVLSVLIRRKTPDMLVEITKITPNITEEAKEKDKRKSRGYIWLAWAYGIPEVLGTKTLTINSGEPNDRIARTAFKSAVRWQLFFGVVLLIYISFSPFLLDFVEMQELASISSFTTTFIPVFILPWFIYLRLDVKIQGPVKDFKIFDGLSSRMFQTIVAFGTMFLLVRLALRNPAFISVMISFLVYSMFFVSGTLIFTFIYFNYFENDLAQDIARRYDEIREP